jgi:hypothetical protein
MIYTSVVSTLLFRWIVYIVVDFISDNENLIVFDCTIFVKFQDR